MGSGSSKSKSQKAAPETKKPVANVNKEEKIAPPEIKHPPAHEVIKNDNTQMVRKQEENDYDMQAKEKNKNGKSNKKKMKVESSRHEKPDTGLVFEDDSDIDNDIDEVLKIPMAIEYPQSKKDKNKKDQRGRVSQRDSNFNNNTERDSSIGRRDENLPETYAQRLQRQQYKLQQDMLIRQKTLYRNPNEWELPDDEEEDFQPGGFDALRFREANKRPDVKRELFTTHDNDELMTLRYMQSGQNLDEVQINRPVESPDWKVPSYNQSELDLMAEIERDLL